MRCPRWSQGLLLRSRPHMAFVGLCGAGAVLLLWTQALFHGFGGPWFKSRVHATHRVTAGSEAGTPCLRSRLYGINCASLFTGNLTYVEQLATRREWKESGLCKRKSLQTLVRDCETTKRHHGYYRWHVTPEELDFPLAFGLKIHHAPDMFERLLRALWRPHNFYCLHVDRKAPPEVFAIAKRLTECFDNVVLTESRVDLIYLSIGSLLSDMECMRVALKSGVPWRYYLNLSGQEFPLKTNLEMVQILALLNGKNDVESYLPTKFVTTWFEFKHVIFNGTVYTTKERKAPFRYPIQIRKGSAYGSFSRRFLDFALNSQFAKHFLSWLVDTQAPDEIFWATLNHLPRVPGSVAHWVSHRYETMLSRAVVWKWDKYKCRTYVRGVCIFTASDLPWLASRPELIANKFDDSTDPIVLDCLEEALEERTLSAYGQLASRGGPRRVDSLNWTFYQSLPHLKY